MSQTFEFEDLVLLCQHIRAISATPSAKFTIRDPEMPGIGPTLSVELMSLASLEIRQTVSVESVAPETINAIRES